MTSWQDQEVVSLTAGPEDRPVRSLYVHAPFCVRRCFYCDFAVQVRSQGDADGWAQALARELALVQEEGLFFLPGALDTLYVGGGTPSLLGPEAMGLLAGIVGFHRLQDPGLEWTAEANPESFTDEVARGWAQAGVNRLSLGAQSFQEPVLRWMGRMHGPEGAGAAVATARRAGVEHLSVDLIFGLPSALGRSWTLDLERALALEVPHLSLYGLSVEEGTPLGRAVREGREPPLDESRYRDEYLEAVEALEVAGYHHYEVSNFARPGFESRHNTVYWTGEPWLALGNGAHSYRHPRRRWNVRDWSAYEEAVGEGRLPIAGEETLDGGATRLERLWLGLRTRRGLATGNLTADARRVVAAWEERGWGVETAGRLRLTAEGWLLLDRLAVELDEALDGRLPGPTPAPTGLGTRVAWASPGY